MALTTTDFLKDVRQRGQIPSLTTDGISAPELEVVTDEGLLRLASGELRTWMAPRLLESRGEWLVASQDFTLSTERRYRIPSRAVGGSLRTLFWVPSGTTETVELSQMDAGEEPRRRGDFRVEGAYVVLLNPNITSGALRMAYHVRPSTLVATGTAATAATVTYSSGLNQTTVVFSGTMPSWMASESAVPLLDCIGGASPYEVRAIQLTKSSWASNSLPFSGNFTSSISAGDFLLPFGTTSVLPLPEDWWELFAQRVAGRALEVAGLVKEAKAAYDTLEGLLEGLAVVTSRERVQSSRRKVRNTSMWGG